MACLLIKFNLNIFYILDKTVFDFSTKGMEHHGPCIFIFVFHAGEFGRKKNGYKVTELAMDEGVVFFSNLRVCLTLLDGSNSLSVIKWLSFLTPHRLMLDMERCNLFGVDLGFSVKNHFFPTFIQHEKEKDRCVSKLEHSLSRTKILRFLVI